MGSSLPEPLVQAEVDLRNFPYMPLDVVRLRDSDIAATPNAEAFRCAVLSWCASWHQVPAASLPSDDAALARLLGFGRDIKGWLRARKAGALHGWIECSDGRLYHPVVAEKAIEAWDSKRGQRQRTEAARRARAALRQCAPEPRPPSVTDTPTDTPTDDVADTNGTERNGTELKATSVDVACPRPSAADPPRQAVAVNGRKPGVPDCPHVDVLALWAKVLPSMPQHDPAQWRGSRADHLRARWRETAVAKGWTTQAEGLAYLRRLFGYVGESAFLTGREHDPRRRPFFAELAWLVEPQNWAKVHEGKYCP